jgi:hypothetical protein
MLTEKAASGKKRITLLYKTVIFVCSFLFQTASDLMKLGKQVFPNTFITNSTSEISLCEYGKYGSIIGFAINRMEQNIPSWQLLVRFKILMVVTMTLTVF